MRHILATTRNFFCRSPGGRELFRGRMSRRTVRARAALMGVIVACMRVGYRGVGVSREGLVSGLGGIGDAHYREGLWAGMPRRAAPGYRPRIVVRGMLSPVWRRRGVRGWSWLMVRIPRVPPLWIPAFAGMTSKGRNDGVGRVRGWNRLMVGLPRRAPGYRPPPVWREGGGRALLVGVPAFAGTTLLGGGKCCDWGCEEELAGGWDAPLGRPWIPAFAGMEAMGEEGA